MVGMTGFEPAASWSQTKRSTKLSHIPIIKYLVFVCGQVRFYCNLQRMKSEKKRDSLRSSALIDFDCCRLFPLKYSCSVCLFLVITTSLHPPQAALHKSFVIANFHTHKYMVLWSLSKGKSKNFKSKCTKPQFATLHNMKIIQQCAKNVKTS